MKDDLETILNQIKAQLRLLKTKSEIEGLKAHTLGSKGSFTQARKKIGTLPVTERAAFGKRVNAVKNEIEQLFEEILEKMETAEQIAQLGAPVDATLPSPLSSLGSLHPLRQVQEEITSIFSKIGFVLAEGPSIETYYYCFEGLNFPPDHPALDMQDTYFLPEGTSVFNVSQKDREGYLLRTHTSSVQIRMLLEEEPPLKIISPGRCYRRDTADATHSSNFHQIEGFFIHHNVSIKDLKATLDFFIQELFGTSTETRLRPSYFPFTEPSFELDVRSPKLGKLSNQWLEVMGCGLIHPSVLEGAGLDAEAWTGFAFGMGVERIAMLLHGIDDIRLFYQNDLRFLRQWR